MKLRLLLTLLLLSGWLSATVTVSASLKDSRGNPLPFAFLKLHLNYCGYNVPEVPSLGVSMLSKDLTLTPSQLPATIYANNEITCGGSYSTLWHVTAYTDSAKPIAGDYDYDLCSSTTACASGTATASWDLTTATPFTVSPGVPPPPGYFALFGNSLSTQTWTQPVGTSADFVGTFDFTRATVLGVVGGVPILFSGVPTGSCSSTQTAVNTLTGDYYSCSSGAWVKVGPGVGGLADPGSNGPLKRTGLNMTAVATAADIIGLFSACSGTQYLGADGACHTSSGGVNAGTAVQQAVYSTSGTVVSGQAKPVIDVRDYGVKCDAATNDSTAMNSALAAAVAVGTGTGLTAEVAIPSGICLGNFTIVQGKGLKIHGTGELSTVLRSPNANPALQVNGLWYSYFSDMSFQTTTHTTANAVVEIDGNYDGTHHQTVQFLTFTNVLVAGQGTGDGQLSLYTVAVCRQSSGSCQGSNLTFINPAFSGASSAVYVQNGFNALSNQFLGGDFQVYTTNGMYINSGAVQVLGTTFETANQCSQVLNNGYDINTVGGNLQANTISGVRSEGWQMVSGTASAPVSIDGLTQNSDWTTYASNTNYALNTAIKKTGSDSKSHLYCVTVAGRSGSSPPTWPASGTVSDNTITWTEEDYNAVTLGAGNPNGFFNQMDSVLDSSAMVSIPNWYFPLGTVTGTGSGSSISYDIAVGSSVSAEHFIESQGTYFVDLFANPNSTATSAYSGISLPGTSVGILNKTGDLWLGAALRVSHGDSIYHLSGQLASTLATGTAPFVVASTTNVANLNASSLNGATFAAPGAIGGGTQSTGAFTTLSATGQVTSTLATGTAPFSIASTTPVANLTTVPLTYNIGGTQQTAVHIVRDHCTLGTSCSITLTGAAVFTSSTSYECSATDETSAAAVHFAPSSGNAFALTGTGTDVLSFTCTGN